MKQGGTLSDVARAAGRHRSTIHAYKGREWFDCHQLPDGSWDVAGAAEAIKQNVDIRRQFSADCRHHRDRSEPEKLYSGWGSIRAMHAAAARAFGVSFADDVDQDFTFQELQDHVTEGLELIMDGLAQVACGEDPVKSACGAVVMALTTCTPFVVSIDVDHFESLVDVMKTLSDEE